MIFRVCGNCRNGIKEKALEGLKYFEKLIGLKHFETIMEAE